MKVSKLRARTSMRHLAGKDIPRADTTSFGMRNALKKAKRASGGVCMGEVDGESKRAPLNKAVMRRNCGGKVGKAEGGEIKDKSPPNPGEVSNKDSAKYLRGKAGEKSKESDSDFWKGLGSTAVGTAGTMLATKVPILGRGSAAPMVGGAGYGAKKMVDSISKGNEAGTLRDEAAKFEKAEDRKRGGRAGKADGGGAWTGEGDSGRPLKEKSAELRDEGKTASNVAKGLGAASLASFGGMLKSRSIPRALAAGYTAMGTGAATAATAGRSMLKHNRADAADAEADKAEGRKSGGPLDTKERKALPGKSFAGPDRSYPINDENHARNALSRVSQFGSPGLKSRVRGAVARKFPGIGK